MTDTTSMEDLKERAEELGIGFPKNISRVKLEKLITAAGTPEETPSQQRVRKRKAANALTRVIVTSLDPLDDMNSAVTAMTSNTLTGMVRTVIQLGVPWHVPLINLNWLRERMMVQMDSKGKVRKVQKYQIEVLPPITLKEVKDLKHQQALRAESGINA